MTQKQLMLMALAIVGCGILVYEYKDWFSARPIQISHRFYAFGGRFDTGGGKAPLMFEFDRKLKLTSIKVVSLADLLTNKYPHALWHMKSKTTSVPTRGFLYGMDVPGMESALKGVPADPLDAAGKYRLLIEAGSLKGQHDFDLDLSPH